MLSSASVVKAIVYMHIARTEPIPAEFLGRARDLRRRIEVADDAMQQLLDGVGFPLLHDIRRRHKLPREEALRAAAREWRMNAPAFGRLAQSISVGRKHLAIDEIRVGSSHYRRADWTAVEPGLLIMHVAIAIASAPKTIEVGITSLVQFSLHALARRFQKGWRVDDAAIIEDARIVGMAHDRLATRPDGTLVTIPLTDGCWVGQVAEVVMRQAQKERIVSVRTFLAEGEMTR